MKNFKFDRKSIFLLTLAFVLICFAIFYIVELCTESKIYYEDEVVAHFVDVGQGDCAVITSPYGNVIIDAGLYDEVERTVAYIDSIGVKDFKYAIFTHPHSDHIGGAGTIISNYNVETVVLPNVISTYTPFEKMLEAIKQKECNVIEGKAGVS
ncbi:MAG: MBL fold metallo-hydrolase, partial [Clostridia bacterium]|nr:MBL fold metallo-hydrolase [Clostridia bacterium]